MLKGHEEIVCQITQLPMKVPVLSDSGNSFEFTAIARWLLKSACKNPVDITQTISVLILNNAVRSDEAVLTPEEKADIAQCLINLKKSFPKLIVRGIDNIEGISTLVDQATPLENRDPETHNHRIKPLLLNAVKSQDMMAVSQALEQLIGPAPGTYCVEAFHESIIRGDRRIVELFLNVPELNVVSCFPPDTDQSTIYQAVRCNHADILSLIFNIMREQRIYRYQTDRFRPEQTLLQLANASNAYEAMEVLLKELNGDIDPNQLISDDVNQYPIPIFHRVVKKGILSLTKAFLKCNELKPYFDGAYERTPLYLAKTCGNPEVMNVLLDHYIHYIRRDAESLPNTFKANSSSLVNLCKHRDELWDRLRTIIKSEMTNKHYLSLLTEIAKPNQLFGGHETHPLHLIFSSSNSTSYLEWGISLFMGRNIIQEIEEEINQMNQSFERVLN